MSKLNVLVVGASIAGPSVAYWFAKAGARVTVIERFPKLRTNGQSIDIRTTGVTVMRKIPGMEESVRAKSTQIEGFSIVRGDGRAYGTLRPTGNPDQQALVSEFEIFRGDLGRILFDLTSGNENIAYVFGEQVASIAQSGGGEKGGADGPVTVEFANGHPSATYDLVVACDGAASRTRALGLGCGARDHVTPRNCWAAYFSIERDILRGSKLGQMYSAPGGRMLAVGPDPRGLTQVTMMGISPIGRHDGALGFREALREGTGALKRYVAGQYRGVGFARTDEILEAMMEADDFYGSEVVTVRPPTLSKGRFVLVGDAGYAPGFTGGGTTLALTGAYILAGEISRHKGDIAAGLAGYERQMRPIITELQKEPPLFMSFVAPQTAWGIWLRNRIFAFIMWTNVLNFLQSLFSGAFANSDKYNLPEYDWVA